MWMTAYIQAVQCAFRDQHGFRPMAGSTDESPTFDNIPNGTYPMQIDGKTDYVRITDGAISCCNFDPPDHGKTTEDKL